MMCRNFICVIIIFSFAFQIKAQVIYERTYPNAFPSIRHSIELSDTSTFSLDRADICNSLLIRHIDKSGNIVDTLSFGAEAFLYGFHWIGHDSVLVWVEHGAHDFGPDMFFIKLWTPQKITTLLSEEVPRSFVQGRTYGAFLYRENQLIYEKSDTFFLRNLLTGENDWMIFLPGVTDVIEFENSILTISNNQRPRLYDQDLNQLATWQNYPDFYLDTSLVVVLDSFWIGKSPTLPSALDIVNVFTESVQHIDVSQFLDSIQDIQTNQGYLFVSGMFEGINQVVQYDKSFELVQVRQLDVPTVKESMELRYSPARVYAWAIDGIGGYKADYRICYAYTDPYEIESFDISLDSMWISSIENFPGFSKIQISLIVKNRSTEVLKRFTLHHDKNEPEGNCFSGTNARNFGNLNVDPEQTDTVSFIDYTTSFAHDYPLHRIYFVEHGNNHLNADTTDNSFDLWHILSNANAAVELDVNVYPNPFTDFLRVEQASGTAQLYLYDLTGKLVFKGQNPLNGLSGLPTGVYLLQIIDGNQSNQQQVVKVE